MTEHVRTLPKAINWKLKSQVFLPKSFHGKLTALTSGKLVGILEKQVLVLPWAHKLFVYEALNV